MARKAAWPAENEQQGRSLSQDVLDVLGKMVNETTGGLLAPLETRPGFGCALVEACTGKSSLKVRVMAATRLRDFLVRCWPAELETTPAEAKDDAEGEAVEQDGAFVVEASEVLPIRQALLRCLLRCDDADVAPLLQRSVLPLSLPPMR